MVLTGTVETPLDASRAAQLAQIFVTGGEATTGQYSLTAAGGSPNGGVDINNPDQTRQISQIVNLLTIIGEDQVTLKVTVAEVSRSVMKQLGVNLIGSDASSGISWAAISDNIMGLGKPLSNSQLALGTSVLTAFINAMEQAGVMKTLAEPTLDRCLWREGDLPGRRRVQSGQRPVRQSGRSRQRASPTRSPMTSKSSNTASASNSSRSCCLPAASA